MKHFHSKKVSVLPTFYQKKKCATLALFKSVSIFAQFLFLMLFAFNSKLCTKFFYSFFFTKYENTETDNNLNLSFFFHLYFINPQNFAFFEETKHFFCWKQTKYFNSFYCKRHMNANLTFKHFFIDVIQ